MTEVPSWAIDHLIATTRSRLIDATLPHDDLGVARALAAWALTESFARSARVIPFKPRVVTSDGGDSAA